MNAETPSYSSLATAHKEPSLEDLLRTHGLLRVPFSPQDKTSDILSIESQREARIALDTTAALRSVMLLTGRPGTGKSTLIKTWMRGLEPKRFLPILITQASLSATGVLEVLLAKLGERPRFKRSGNLVALEKHLADLDPLTLVLALDDAQNYPSYALEELRMLLGLGGRQRNAFALILLGDEYLLGSLSLSVQRALFGRISVACEVESLPREQIEQYLNWHMAQVGCNREVFLPAAIDLLTEASEGNPRTLNLLAQSAWLASARAGNSDVAPEHVHRALQQVPAGKAKIKAA